MFISQKKLRYINGINVFTLNQRWNARIRRIKMLMLFDVPKEVVGNLNIKDGKTNVSEETLIDIMKYIDTGVIILDGATNGDIIKAMFPNCKDWKATYAGEEIHLVQLPNSLRINEYLESWWNAPYKEELGE
jgi:hypothetical protein